MQTRCKMPKDHKQKKCITNFAIETQKKTSTTQKKNATPKNMHTKRVCMLEACSMCAKVHQRGLQAPTTWSVALPTFFWQITSS